MIFSLMRADIAIFVARRSAPRMRYRSGAAIFFTFSPCRAALHAN
jgi:hypothetical protein